MVLTEFNEDFKKSYNEKSNERYFLEVDIQYFENLMSFTMIYHVCLKQREFIKS